MGNDLKDELISLQAIFEDNVEFNDEEKCLSYFNKSNKIVLEAVINEDYPQTLPLISVKNKNSAQIENELRQLCTQKIGFPMLFDLISKFDEMIEKIQSKERTKPSSRAMGSGKSTTSTEESVCSFFLKGSCRFGDNCFNLHPEVMNNSGSNDSTKVSTTIPSETKKIETRSRRTKKEDKVDVSKKPSMKTAMDVINRILWDESLPMENFVVGYLDRFTGIQEKKFEEFSWEDIASVDDHVVFAVPKHRIQYFKYRNVKVWEKSIRMDKVFNSTGDKESLVDIIKIEDESFDSSHVKEETKIDEPCMQRNNPRRPNAFLCIPITCDSIRSKIKKVQEDLLSYDDRLENFLYDVNWLHVTVCMFRLNSDADTKKANTVLVSLQPLLASMLGCYRLKLREVGNFRNLVIYIDVECDLVLEKFVGIAKQRLDKGGISLVGNYDVYHPHVTILKMKPKEYTELNLNGVAFMYKKWQSQIFGEQKVESLKICDTGKSRGLDGFYVTRGVVCNRFCILSTKLGKLLARRIRQLQERSLILEDEADELIDDLLSTDNMERVEKAVEYLTVNHMHNAESGRYVIVLRGLMGSGKSTLAKKIIAGSPAMRVASCSADDYFVKKNIIDESYEFSATEIQQAHQNCRDCFSQLLLEECEMVIVDNCHAQKWEYHFYQHVAALCGYKSHLLEISCPDEATLKKFQHRSVHNVKPEVSLATWKRWEIDNESFRVADTDNFQISDLFERKVSVNLSNVLFAALYLDTASKDLLKKNYHVVHKHVFADHVTLIHKPNVEQLKTIPIGSNHRVKVIGYVIDADVEVVAVKEVSDQLCQMPNPHVTISTRPGVKPVASAKALEITRNWSQPKSELILTGKIGLQIRINKTESKVCFDQCTFKEESPNARTTNISAEKEPSVKTKKKEKCDDEEKVNLYFGTQEKVVEEIYIFDFDSTLFYTPGPVGGRQMYTKYTGVPQSLYYPLLVYPGPSLRDYHDHSKRPMAMTCMLTGRIERTRAGVEAVLKDHQLLFDRLMLKDDNRLKNVHQYKKEYVKNLLKEFPTAKEMDVTMRNELQTLFLQQYLEAKNIKERLKNLEECYLLKKFDITAKETELISSYKIELENIDKMRCQPAVDNAKNFIPTNGIRTTDSKRKNGKKPVKCPPCSYQSVNFCHLKLHMRKHTGEKPYKCTECEYASSQKSHLKVHMRKHTGEKPHKCNECEFACSLASSLRTHKRTHTGNKPFKCTECDYASSQHGNLQVHMRRHTGERPYKCTQCKYVSSNSTNLRLHMRKHTGEKPYKCSECEYSSAQLVHVKSHMKTHLQKPFVCTECDYVCPQSNHLRLHMRKHEREHIRNNATTKMTMK